MVLDEEEEEAKASKKRKKASAEDEEDVSASLVCLSSQASRGTPYLFDLPWDEGYSFRNGAPITLVTGDTPPEPLLHGIVSDDEPDLNEAEDRIPGNTTSLPDGVKPTHMLLGVFRAADCKKPGLWKLIRPLSVVRGEAKFLIQVVSFAIKLLLVS